MTSSSSYKKLEDENNPDGQQELRSPVRRTIIKKNKKLNIYYELHIATVQVAIRYLKKSGKFTYSSMKNI